MTLIRRLAALLIALTACTPSADADDGLVAHWPLRSDANDVVGGHHAVNHGVKFVDGRGKFDGRGAWLEAPASAKLFDDGDFSIAVWIHTDRRLDDVLGDVLSCYDPDNRRGVSLSLMNYSGVTSAQSNWRNLLFGVDDGGGEPQWEDCGRPGTNRYVKSLVVFAGDLYAGVWQPGEGQAGRVYRYAGGTQWVDCGSPDKANAVTGMAVHDGRLYVGSELYSGGGSSLPLSPNTRHGGRVFRYEGGTRWSDVGKVGDVRSVSGLASFRGKLYAGTGTSGGWRDTPRSRGMYRLDDGGWTHCGCPGSRIVHLAVHDGSLFGLSYDGGGFFRYEGGSQWTQLGPVPHTSQVYSTAVYRGRMHVGTWPTGAVYRFEPPRRWVDTGRLGDEKEVMGMAVYNGKLYAGTLPSAEVYRYDGEGRWVSTGQLDQTTGVRYRRAWSMAVYDGKLFCGVLPSGRVHALQAGSCVTCDREIPPGWRHLAAVSEGGRLRLHVDGRQVAASDRSASSRINLDAVGPLKIGFGQHDYFNGSMRDLRIYRRALRAGEIAALGGRN